MNETTFRDSMLRNCKSVFATMLGIDISEIPPSQEIPAMADSERVVSLIGFGGDYSGNCMLSCSAPLACKLASTMMMDEYGAVNGEVMDALGEISNMVFGNVKAELEDHLGPLQLSIPTVIVGREFNVRSLANPSWVVIPLQVEDDVFEARMCVSLNPGRLSAPQKVRLAS